MNRILTLSFLCAGARLSEIKPGGPPPGPLPSGANVDALRAYRDIAVKVIQAGKGGVGTQALRVDANRGYCNRGRSRVAFGDGNRGGRNRN